MTRPEPSQRRPRWGSARVHGRSMEPTLRGGDLLLVSYAAPPHPGQVAVVRFADGVVAVKRLDHRATDGWWVTRDNPTQGRDSSTAGHVADAAVLAVVRARIWPRPGRIGRGLAGRRG